MFPQRNRTRGRLARVTPTMFKAARAGVIGLAVLGAGCASKHAAHEAPAHVAGPRQQAPGPWMAKVEIEDDGLPTQFGPRGGSRIPDDPSQPWSPNYGQRPGARSAAAEPIQPRGEPPRRPYERLSSMDEDAIIRRAVAEHEMRRGN